MTTISPVHCFQLLLSCTMVPTRMETEVTTKRAGPLLAVSFRVSGLFTFEATSQACQWCLAAPGASGLTQSLKGSPSLRSPGLPTIHSSVRKCYCLGLLTRSRGRYRQVTAHFNFTKFYFTNTCSFDNHRCSNIDLFTQ